MARGTVRLTNIRQLRCGPGNCVVNQYKAAQVWSKYLEQSISQIDSPLTNRRSGVLGSGVSISIDKDQTKSHNVQSTVSSELIPQFFRLKHNKEGRIGFELIQSSLDSVIMESYYDRTCSPYGKCRHVTLLTATNTDPDSYEHKAFETVLCTRSIHHALKEKNTFIQTIPNIQ